VYGECPASSRKNIRRGKRRSHMEIRRAVAEELRAVKGTSVDSDSDASEIRTTTRMAELERSSFKKMPDAPLAVVLRRKAKKRKKEAVTRGNWNQHERSEARLLRNMKHK